MNPGPTLGAWAVGAAYTVVLLSLLVFMKFMSGKKKKLEARRKELQKG
jgi:hypothetical protein